MKIFTLLSLVILFNTTASAQVVHTKSPSTETITVPVYDSLGNITQYEEVLKPVLDTIPFIKKGTTVGYTVYEWHSVIPVNESGKIGHQNKSYTKGDWFIVKYLDKNMKLIPRRKLKKNNTPPF